MMPAGCARIGTGMQTDETIRFIHQLTAKSGEIIRPYFADVDLQIDTKADQSIVTAADREAERALRELILSRYPEHGIIGEEFGNENESAEFVWILDPVDGTISFAKGCPLFGTLIGLLHEGRPIVGAIHNPILNQLCIGDGTITTINGRETRVRDNVEIDDATLLTTDIKHIAEHQNADGFDALLEEVKTFRGWGDCYGYLMLALGSADIMVDPVMNAWDLLPLVPVIEGAGGVITTWDGGDPVKGTSCVAATPSLHAYVIERLNP